MTKLRHSGFTLVETLVSLAVLMSFFAIVTIIFAFVTDLIGEARVRAVAVALASERIEQVRNLSFDDIGTQGGIPSGSLLQAETVDINGQTFEISTTVVYVDDPFDDEAPDDPIPTDYKRVRVEVNWGGPFASTKPVVLVTDSMPDGIESIVGGGTLIFSVINSLGEPVSNAQISIENTSVDPAIDLDIVTNDSGRVLLPGAPACNDCYNISVSKSGYTTERTYSLSEIANPLKPPAAVIEGQVTSLTFTIDQAATLDVTTTRSREQGYPPFAGIQFTLTGTKIIGYDALDNPVLKYDEAHASGPGGKLVISNLEPDTYSVGIPSSAVVDFAGSNPLSPFPLLPGSTRYLTVVTAAATGSNLFVTVQDISEAPIATATATLKGLGSFIATKSAGPIGTGDYGQLLFSGLTPGAYSLSVSQVGYQSATSSANVSGETSQKVILEVP